MKKLYRYLEKNDTPLGMIMDYVIVVLILLNILAVIFQSFDKIDSIYTNYFNIFEVISVIIFTIEFVLRVIVSPYRFSSKYEPKYIIKYIFSFSAFIDILAIIPFYLPLLSNFDLRFLRSIRLFRLFRILKLTRYIKAVELIKNVFWKRRAELLISTCFLLVIVFFLGTFIYYAENNSQPIVFSNILKSISWTINTMVFLGYEEYPPISELGKALGMITVFLGLGWITLPISILSSGFLEEISEQKKKT